MEHKDRMKSLKNEDGAALVLAMMVLVVLSILGAMVGTLTVGSYRLSDNNQDYNSAYYIAEAGANMAYEEIESQVMNIYIKSKTQSDYFESELGIPSITSKLNGKEYGVGIFDSQNAVQPTATISVEGPTGNGKSRDYIIKSIGEVAGIIRQVNKNITISWIDTDTYNNIGIPHEQSGIALLAKNQLNFTGGNIDGNIFIDSNQPKSFTLGSWGTIEGDSVFTSYSGNRRNILGDVPLWRLQQMPDLLNKIKSPPYNPTWEDYELLLNNIKLPSNYEVFNNVKNQEITKPSQGKLEENSKGYKIDITQSGTTNIYTDKDEEINIVLNKLNISGNGKLNIIGDGQVNIYVKEQFSISASGAINNGGNRSQLRLYYFGKSPITIAGDTKINGNLLVENANIKLTASGGVTGAVISGGSNITITGGSQNNIVIVAPKNHSIVNFDNGLINGSIIAGNINMTNGTLNYEWFNPGILFPDSNGSEKEVDLNELISTEPALEF